MNAADQGNATYVTRITHSSPAAIAVIELRGPRAEAMTLQGWTPATVSPLVVNAIRFGCWGKGGPHPEDIVVCKTSERLIELHCHGGEFAAERIIQDLLSFGAERIDELRQNLAAVIGAVSKTPDEMNVDRSRWADWAWQDLLKTKSPATTVLMLRQARGALINAVARIDDLIDEQQWNEAGEWIDRLTARHRIGLHLMEPWKVAIIGPPNSGKSRLLNAILGFDRAIVAPIPGTTRDVLDERVSLLGWPFSILDTAGIRDAEDVIEREGISRARAAAERADLILALIDPEVGWASLHDELMAEHSDKLLFIATKSDLNLAAPLRRDVPAPLEVSSVTGVGLPLLYQSMVERLIVDQDLISVMHAELPNDSAGRASAMKVDSDLRCAVPYLPDHMACLESLKAKVLHRLARVAKLD
jgi:tRNA modification GTPase